MTAGPITTKIEVAQCQKCQAYVFNSVVSGITTMVDVVTLKTIDEWRQALVAGKSLYIAVNVNGKPHKLNPVYAKQIKTAEAGGHALYATHGCAAAGVVRASKVEVAPAGPPSAPVTPGGSRDGFRHATAPVGGSQGRTAKISKEELRAYFAPRSHAGNATLRPSRCCVCRKLLTGKEEGVTAIEYDGRIIWGFHGTC